VGEITTALLIKKYRHDQNTREQRLADAQKNYYGFVLALASLPTSFLAISSFSVIAWGKIKPPLKHITATRPQWPILLVSVESVVAGLTTLSCLLAFGHRNLFPP
jgi:hypothetical protein